MRCFTKSIVIFWIHSHFSRRWKIKVKRSNFRKHFIAWKVSLCVKHVYIWLTAKYEGEKAIAEGATIATATVAALPMPDNVVFIRATFHMQYVCIRCSQLKWILSCCWWIYVLVVCMCTVIFFHFRISNEVCGVLNNKAWLLPLFFPAYKLFSIHVLVNSVCRRHSVACSAAAVVCCCASFHFWLRRLDWHFSFHMTIRSPFARFCSAFARTHTRTRAHMHARTPFSQFHLYAAELPLMHVIWFLRFTSKKSIWIIQAIV